MKKIINLTLVIGLAVILFIITISFSSAKASESSQGITGISRNPESGGTPWFDEAWRYRQPVIISSSGTTLTWYQVLIKLDGNHFDFSHALIDGSDVRFAYTDGITELKYWIESWDRVNQLAYIWVRVPNLTNGSTTIYIYYGNEEATSTSNGAATFERFDDEWDLPPDGINRNSENIHHGTLGSIISSPFVWLVINGEPIVNSGILSLSPDTGIKSDSLQQYQAMGMRANIGLGAGNEWGGFIDGAGGERTVIGDLPSDPGNLYLIDFRDDFDNVLIPRIGGTDWHNEFHIYEVRWDPDQSRADIDHGASTASSSDSSQIPDDPLPVTLYSYTNSAANLLVDWVYVRLYRYPEPSSQLGSEQGLVKLSVNTSDTPDPVSKSHELTYYLTISNTSEINAPGVLLTDTLPASVQFIDATPSQGSCMYDEAVFCDLNVIYPGSTANVAIRVSPNVDGEITNVAKVGSPGFEINYSDNTSLEQTLVDSVPPAVNWQGPVQNGGTIYTYGGVLILEASATDNDQVAYVEFQYFDHVNEPHGWIYIGSDVTYPYQVPFDTSVLQATSPADPYQTAVIGVDRAGNRSNPGDPLRVIYVIRRHAVYIPLLRK